MPIFSENAAALPSDLDPTFGSGGIVRISFTTGNDRANTMVLQNDGKILLAGRVDQNSSNSSMVLARLLGNGSLDPSFGIGGKVFGSAGLSFSLGTSLALQGDGRIVMGGFAYNGVDYDFALARYTANGSLDNTFGSGGKVITAFSNKDDSVTSVAVQTDGRVVVAGYSKVFTNAHYALARYLADGTLDLGFGTGGKVLTQIGPLYEGASSVTLQNDGKIIVAGSSTSLNGWDDFTLARYLPDGSLDTSFGVGGKLTTVVSTSNDEVAKVRALGDGKILVAGYSEGPNPSARNADFTLVRYLADGSPDPAFGSGGIVITPLATGNDYAKDMALQGDGKIVVAGYSYDIGSNSPRFAITRYLPDGVLDPSFDGDGKLLQTISNSSSIALTVAVQSNGGIVVAGTDRIGSKFDVAVVRYVGGSVPEASTWMLLGNFATGLFGMLRRR